MIEKIKTTKNAKYLEQNPLNFDHSPIDIKADKTSKDLLIGEYPKSRNGFHANSFTGSKRDPLSNVRK